MPVLQRVFGCMWFDLKLNTDIWSREEEALGSQAVKRETGSLYKSRPRCRLVNPTP